MAYIVMESWLVEVISLYQLKLKIESASQTQIITCPAAHPNFSEPVN